METTAAKISRQPLACYAIRTSYTLSKKRHIKCCCLHIIPFHLYSGFLCCDYILTRVQKEADPTLERLRSTLRIGEYLLVALGNSHAGCSFVDAGSNILGQYAKVWKRRHSDGYSLWMSEGLSSHS
jgi:hypothetical protein